MTSKQKQLTAEQLASMSAHDIAKQLGLGYSGDMNPIDHDGTFYETSNWQAYGYVSCLRFTRADGHLWVEYGTINRADDMAECLRTIGAESADSVEVEIEACLATWGAEVSDDFGGPYSQMFNENEHDDIDESEVWDSVVGWLYGLVD